MAKKRAKSAKPEPEKSEEDEEIVVICFKVLMMPRPAVAGSSKLPCRQCGQTVWISPATAAFMEGKKHRVCCAECVANSDDPDVRMMPPSDGQIAEMLATDPSITPARVRRSFPASNPAKRKAALEEILRRTRKRKRLDN